MGCELKRMLSGRGFLISFFLGLSAILSGTVWPKGNGNPWYRYCHGAILSWRSQRADF